VSKLSNTFIERRLKVRGTARNWNTVGKLRDLAGPDWRVSSGGPKRKGTSPMRIMLAAAAPGRPWRSAPATNPHRKPRPQGLEETAAAMPDTTQPREPDKAMTAPDAGRDRRGPRQRRAAGHGAGAPRPPAPGGVPQK